MKNSPHLTSPKGRGIKGFTLVELIIVITILAILATIAFISFKGYTSNSRDGNRLATLKNLESGLELYSLKTSKFPTPENITGTGIIGAETLVYVGEIGDSISRNINMSKTPKDPLSNTNYIYGTDTNYSYYQIATVLENGVSYTHQIIPTTYADSSQYQAYVVGNYTYPLRKGTTLYSLPSLIFTGTGNLELNSTGFVVNKGTNTPYKLNSSQTENTQTIEDVLKIITGTGGRTLTGITLTNWDTNSGSLAQTFFGTNSVENIDKVGISYYGVNKYITEIKTSGDTETTPVTPTYTCTGSLVTANANITNTTGLTADTPYQTTNSGNACYYTCKTGYSGTNCETPPPVCPSGFVYIPGSTGKTLASSTPTKGWCVAKYEMTKYDGTWTQDTTYGGWKYTADTSAAINTSPGFVTSKSGDYPITYISQNEAENACVNKLKDNTGNTITGGHLLGIELWGIIARNLEQQAINWSSNTIGTGYMSRGHANYGKSSAGTNDAFSYSTSCYNIAGTRYICPTMTDSTVTNPTDYYSNRMYKLSSGDTIHDFAGNLWEWYYETHNSGGNTTRTYYSNDNTARTVLGSYSTTPTTNYGSNIAEAATTGRGLGGTYNAGTTTGTTYASVFGGIWNSTSSAGVFTSYFNTNSPTSYRNNNIGFRCIAPAQ